MTLQEAREIEKSIANVINVLEQETKIDILNNIYVDIQRLRGCSCSYSDEIIDDIEDILDQYIAEIHSRKRGNTNDLHRKESI